MSQSPEPISPKEMGCILPFIDLVAGIFAFAFVGLGVAGYPLAYVGIFLVLVLLIFGRRMFVPMARRPPEAPPNPDGSGNE